MTTKSHLTIVALSLAFSTAVAALAADQIVVDRKNACQISVPGDWKVNTLLKGSASSPDNTDSVVVSSTSQGQSLNDAKGVMQQMFKPVKVLEDTPQRFWYEYAVSNNQNGKTRAWYVGIPVKGNVCGAQITMKDGNETVAKSIAMSMKAK